MAKNYSSYIEIKSGLKSGEITTEGLVKGYLQQIKANAHLNVFNEVFEDEALASAKKLMHA
jgi:aspartyl-tRNA(Asn)/glutamyl-tRNA(Gln) amidotransferase subunit A